MPNKMPRPLLSLRIDGLEMPARIGVYAHEQTQPQPIRVHLRAQVACPRRAAERVCYDALVERMRHAPMAATRRCWKAWRKNLRTR